jgi:hypothetical protein
LRIESPASRLSWLSSLPTSVTCETLSTIMACPLARSWEISTSGPQRESIVICLLIAQVADHVLRIHNTDAKAYNATANNSMNLLSLHDPETNTPYAAFPATFADLYKTSGKEKASSSQCLKTNLLQRSGLTFFWTT